jgi:hypothetical protein
MTKKGLRELAGLRRVCSAVSGILFADNCTSDFSSSKYIRSTEDLKRSLTFKNREETFRLCGAFFPTKILLRESYVPGQVLFFPNFVVCNYALALTLSAVQQAYCAPVMCWAFLDFMVMTA